MEDKVQRRTPPDYSYTTLHLLVCTSSGDADADAIPGFEPPYLLHSSLNDKFQGRNKTPKRTANANTAQLTLVQPRIPYRNLLGHLQI